MFLSNHIGFKCFLGFGGTSKKFLDALIFAEVKIGTVHAKLSSMEK